MTAWRARVAGVAVICASIAVAGSACGDDHADAEAGGGGADRIGQPIGTSEASSPFTVGHEPTGYRLVQAGRGTVGQNWSSDSFGDDEPVTVLAPAAGDGDPEGPGSVRVSLTGFEGFEGGLHQASRGYTGDTSEEFEIDGQPAIYTPAGDDDRDGDDDGATEPADLVVVAGDDLAVRVSAADADRDELIDVARRVEPRADHLLAPAVPDPPEGLEVVGSADADVAITLVASPYLSSESLPAGERAHSAVWALGETGTAWVPQDGTVAVSTLPGRALDLDALAASFHDHEYLGRPRVTEQEIGGRPGAVVDLDGSDGPSGRFGMLRAVVASAANGDLVLVVAQGTELPAAEELVAVAASVEPATADDWEALVAWAAGGPGLRPDDGAVELSRGTAGDVGWLLQAREDDGTLPYWGSVVGTGTAGQFLVDPCLKLADGSRACPGAGSSETSSSGIDVVNVRPTALEGGGELSGFVIVMTTLPAATVRVPSTGEPVEVPLVELPGGTRRGVAVVAEPGAELVPSGACGGVELEDSAGRAVPCPSAWPRDWSG